jgi:hypothetical protein
VYDAIDDAHEGPTLSNKKTPGVPGEKNVENAGSRLKITKDKSQSESPVRSGSLFFGFGPVGRFDGLFLYFHFAFGIGISISISFAGFVQASFAAARRRHGKILLMLPLPGPELPGPSLK